MFYSIIYKSSLWSTIDPKSRVTRCIILSTIIYVIIHSFLYSYYGDDSEFISQYREFIYYIIAFDMFMGLIMYQKHHL